MQTIKRILIGFVTAVSIVTGCFADSKCDSSAYYRTHKTECEKSSNITTILAVAGGAALAGVGIALANNGSSNNASSPEHSNQTITLRSSNTNSNYALTDKIQNNKIYTSYIYSETNGADISDDILQFAKATETYTKNYKQFDSVNLAYAIARGYTGKNVNIAIMDDFNYHHGYTVHNLAQYAAKDANIANYNLTYSQQSFVPFDKIAETIKYSAPAHIYNNSWQMDSTQYMNAATVVYNNFDPKTYANAQQYMYSITSQNFINQIINTAIENDSIFVWAAGNDSQKESGALSAMPLAFPELNGHFVNVVAFDQNAKKLAWYSNQCGVTQNYCIAAPGSLLQTDAKETTVSGTSFAAPIVSGAIAVIKEAFPYMTATQITELLFTTARDLGDPGVDAVYGWGLLDMETATKPVGTPKIVLSNETIQPLTDANVGGIAASAIKNAGLEIAFVDDFGRAFKTKLSDSINVIPYGRAFGKLQNNEDNFVTIFDNLEFGFKKTNILESNGFITSKSNNLTNFVGYKNEFVFDNFSIYQNVRFGTTAPKSEYNSIINGFSNIYTSSVSTGIKWNDFIFELSIPETILYGNMYMNLPIGRANDGQMLYNQTNINLKTKPSVEYSVKYKNIYAGYINNYDYQDEFFIMAKTKFTF